MNELVHISKRGDAASYDDALNPIWVSQILSLLLLVEISQVAICIKLVYWFFVLYPEDNVSFPVRKCQIGVLLRRLHMWVKPSSQCLKSPETLKHFLH